MIGIDKTIDSTYKGFKCWYIFWLQIEFSTNFRVSNDHQLLEIYFMELVLNYRF